MNITNLPTNTKYWRMSMWSWKVKLTYRRNNCIGRIPLTFCTIFHYKDWLYWHLFTGTTEGRMMLEVIIPIHKYKSIFSGTEYKRSISQPPNSNFLFRIISQRILLVPCSLFFRRMSQKVFVYLSGVCLFENFLHVRGSAKRSFGLDIKWTLFFKQNSDGESQSVKTRANLRF